MVEPAKMHEITEVPQQPLTFLKWFVGVATSVLIMLMLFLFNLAVSNQASIREALAEIKSFAVLQNAIAQDVEKLYQRIDSLSRDPVHGWGERWTRTEAQREISRFDRELERLEKALDKHVDLEAHDQAKVDLIRIRDQLRHISNMMEQHLKKTDAALHSAISHPHNPQNE